MAIAKPTSVDRFWSKVHKTDTCWLWTGVRSGKGYGRIDRTGAHRVSWTIHNGPIPDGMIICHHCDNPPCVNPAHLFVGTIKDNMADCVSKGRHQAMQRTHCPKGHPLSGENLNSRRRGENAALYRNCRACRSALRKAYRQRLRERKTPGVGPIFCGCGCGQPLPSFPSCRGTFARFAKGHNFRSANPRKVSSPAAKEPQ